jgi:glucokinase
VQARFRKDPVQGKAMEEAVVLGIDIGATKTQLARWEGDRLSTSGKIPTLGNSSRFLTDLQTCMEDFLGSAISNIEAIGIGAPGPLDLERGIFKKLPNLPGWDGFDIRGRLESLYGVPVRVQNDANAAALGEAVHGGGRDYDSVYYITISTGIGGGYIVQGNIVNGACHLTGEIWALPVDNFGRPDILINSASGPGIVRTTRRLMKEGEASSLSELESFDTAEVYDHAKRGDRLAGRVMESAARNMAYAVNAIQLVVDPDVVLIGGGLACEDDCMINPIRHHLADMAYFGEHRRSTIRKAELWDEAVLYGAVSLFGRGKE